MDKRRFNQLEASVREAVDIMRGDAEPSRTFEISAPRRRNPERQCFGICVLTDDETLLVPRKVYQVTLTSRGKVSVIDEEGEAALYPAECFVLLDLPPQAESALERAGQR